jgi:hypothetical protein
MSFSEASGLLRDAVRPVTLTFEEEPMKLRLTSPTTAQQRISPAARAAAKAESDAADRAVVDQEIERARRKFDELVRGEEDRALACACLLALLLCSDSLVHVHDAKSCILVLGLVVLRPKTNPT